MSESKNLRNRTLVRLRFETKVIGPAKLPDFVYVASVLSHSSLQYTALVDTKDDEEPQAPLHTVRVCWPDAVFISMERGVDSFQVGDMGLGRIVYGEYTPPPEATKRPLLSRWMAAFGVGRPTIVRKREAHIPGGPLRHSAA